MSSSRLGVWWSTLAGLSTYRKDMLEAKRELGYGLGLFAPQRHMADGHITTACIHLEAISWDCEA